MKITEMKKEDLKIVEGVESVWHYHLSETGETYKSALCGRVQVMHTEIPLSTWGKKGGNVPSSYCTKCDGIYRDMTNSKTGGT